MLMPMLIGMTACDQTSNIGQSVVEETISIVIDSSFTVTGATHTNEAMMARTLTQMLGRIDVKDFGKIESEFVAQFMPTSSLITEGIQSVDSILLVMRIPAGDFIGDSLVPMGMNVYPINRELPYPIFSNTPVEGYYDSSLLLGSTPYSAGVVYNDTIAAMSYREVSVKLRRELAQHLYDSYLADSTLFNNPDAFTTEVFRGLAVRNSFGSGRVVRIAQTLLNLYFTRKFYSEELQRDSIQHIWGSYFAVTPEVINNSHTVFEPAPRLLERVRNGEAIVASPAAYEVEMTFPTLSILNRYNSDKSYLSMVNGLSLSIPVESIDATGTVNPPEYLLMVLSKDKEDFFANNSLPDGVTSFYAAYNSSSHSYTFSDLTGYIIAMLEKDDITATDFTFTLVPVTVTMTTIGSGYYQQQTVGSITPEATMVSGARLVLDKSKIKFTFSKQVAQY